MILTIIITSVSFLILGTFTLIRFNKKNTVNSRCSSYAKLFENRKYESFDNLKYILKNNIKLEGLINE